MFVRVETLRTLFKYLKLKLFYVSSKKKSSRKNEKTETKNFFFLLIIHNTHFIFFYILIMRCTYVCIEKWNAKRSLLRVNFSIIYTYLSNIGGVRHIQSVSQSVSLQAVNRLVGRVRGSESWGSVRRGNQLWDIACVYRGSGKHHIDTRERKTSWGESLELVKKLPCTASVYLFP